jgi:hypothetical protein
MKRRCNKLNAPEGFPLCADEIRTKSSEEEIHYCMPKRGHEKSGAKDARLHRCYDWEWFGE